MTKSNWKEFQDSGLLLFINQMLHLFGWAIVFEQDQRTKDITDVYPAKVKWKGFDHADVYESYAKITKHLSDNIDFLKSSFDEETKEKFKL